MSSDFDIHSFSRWSHRNEVLDSIRSWLQGMSMRGYTVKLRQAYEARKRGLTEMTSAERMATEDMKSPAMSVLVRAVAGEVASLLRLEFARLAPPDVQPVLLNVKQAAVYLGRTEQSVQHLIFQRDLPVVRMGRRVHLHRRDLDLWIEKNEY